MEAGTNGKAAVLGLIGLLCCGLCYSIGWQSGFTNAIRESDTRLETMTRSVREMNGDPLAVPTAVEHADSRIATPRHDGPA